MAISSETIGRLNEECQRIPLTDERVAELPIELGQLARGGRGRARPTTTSTGCPPPSSKRCTR